MRPGTGSFAAPGTRLYGLCIIVYNVSVRGQGGQKWQLSIGARGLKTVTYDVIVVGGGNAAFAAATAAREEGASVLVLERAPRDEAGGNTRFTAGAIRFAYDGVADLRQLMPDLTDAEVARSDFGTYPEDKFFDDMGRVTEYRTDPMLCELLVKRSRSTILWMREQGIRFTPIWGRQAFLVDGKFKFWGGLTVEAWGGGPGLVEAWNAVAKRRGIDIRYGCRALSLIANDDGVQGVRVKEGGRASLSAPAQDAALLRGRRAERGWRRAGRAERHGHRANCSGALLVLAVLTLGSGK